MIFANSATDLLPSRVARTDFGEKIAEDQVRKIWVHGRVYQIWGLLSQERQDVNRPFLSFGGLRLGRCWGSGSMPCLWAVLEGIGIDDYWLGGILESIAPDPRPTVAHRPRNLLLNHPFRSKQLFGIHILSVLFCPARFVSRSQECYQWKASFLISSTGGMVPGNKK